MHVTATKCVITVIPQVHGTSHRLICVQFNIAPHLMGSLLKAIRLCTEYFVDLIALRKENHVIMFSTFLFLK